MAQAFGTGSNSSTHDQWQDLAGRVAVIIRDSGIDNFRQAVQHWAVNQVEAEDKRRKREEERLEAIKKDGVLYHNGSIPDKPKGDWFFHLETLLGSIKLDPEFALPLELALLPAPPQPPEPPMCLRDKVPRVSWSDTDKKEEETFQTAMREFQEQEKKFLAQRAQVMQTIFRHVKQHGFPDQEEDGFPYEFEVCTWLRAITECCVL